MKVRFCAHCGAVLKEYNHSKYCNKHLKQLEKYNEFKDCNPRTVFDPNEIRVKGNITEIDTYDAFGNVNYTYTIDTEDIPMLNIGKLKWKTNIKHGKTPYLYTFINNHIIYFHRLVLGLPNNTIDHIDRNTLNNCKSNLRIATKGENNRNRDTGFIKGIYIDNRRNTYFSAITKDRKTYYSKGFKTYAEAVYWRYLAEECIYKDDSFYFNRKSEMIEYINTLTQEQKSFIQLYFRNKSKDWV